ncbi:MAG: hypothetical protein HYR94_02225 [Chloroflexi bacterium]|nr:hypothetical protein [Chloroflexota bacterium]
MMRILMLDNEYPPLGGGMGTANQALLEHFGSEWAARGNSLERPHQDFQSAGLEPESTPFYK